jgi:uncharacterized CHY-type Zn-finger protein
MANPRFCDRCNREVACYKPHGGLWLIRDLEKMGFWCPNCKGVLCGGCAGISGQATHGRLTFVGDCPVCGTETVPANNEHLTSRPVTSLSKPWWKVWGR